MDIRKVIKARRSIRKYKADPVPEREKSNSPRGENRW